MAGITWRCKCGYQNNQDSETIESREKAIQLDDNVYRLLTAWLKPGNANLTKGRTYCDHCYEPFEFNILFGAQCPIIS